MITLFAGLYVRFEILPTCGEHLHDRIISLSGGLGPTTSLYTPHFIDED